MEQSQQQDQLSSFIEEQFEPVLIKGLQEVVRVPSLTPMVDPEFLTNGLIHKVIEVIDQYARKMDIKGLTRHIYQPEGVNPMVIYVIEGTEGCTKNVMLYGHMDKQPYGPGWEEGLSPIDPQIRGDYMMGRGSADDGYAPFASLLALKAVQSSGQPHPRCVLVLESEEESGSPNLLTLLKLAEPVIQTPDILFCMDSGALDYTQLWLTSSLRGICIVDLTVEAAKSGYHSGETGGMIPETFRVVRALLGRLDDAESGKVCEELHMEVPEFKRKEAQHIAAKYGEHLYKEFNLHEGVQVLCQDNMESMYLNKTWHPNLSITGADGLPPIATAGNVIRPKTSVRCSMRLPPTYDAKKANELMVKKLTENVPYNAKVTT